MSERIDDESRFPDLASLLGRLDQVKRSGSGWTACCPAHADKNPSLSVSVGDNGKILLHCHSAKCTFKAIIDAIESKRGGPNPHSEPVRAKASAKVQRRIVEEYDYVDANGKLLYQVVRFEPKDFRQRRPDGDGDWIWGLKNVRRVPFHLPRLLQSDRSKWVCIPEGEKDVLRLEGFKLVATTNAQGAGKFGTLDPECVKQAFAGRKVAIIPDNDEPGLQHAYDVATRLTGIASEVRIVRLPGLPPKGDVSDWLNMGGTLEQLQQLVEDATEFDPSSVIPSPESLDAKDWEPPIPLTERERLPAFPIDALPPVLREWALAVAEQTQTPPDLAAMLGLSIAGAGVARNVRVSIRAGWYEPLNLFCVVALPSGERKSAVFNLAREPVVALESEACERMKSEIAAATTRKKIAEQSLKKAEELASKPSEPATRNARIAIASDLAKDLAKFVVPRAPRFWCEDATPEVLVKMLAEQNGRMLIASAEGTPFEICSGRYSEGANFDVFLKAHAGDPLRCDRIGRASDSIERPALSVAVAVQPDVVFGLADDPTMKSKGFLARFLYSFPVSLVGKRNVDTTAIPDSVASGYGRLIRRLWSISAKNDSDDGFEPHTLALSPEAESTMRSFQHWLEPQLGQDGSLAFLCGWASKLAGAVARIVSILHLCGDSGRNDALNAPIADATLQAAIRIGRDYLLPHARSGFERMHADRALEGALKIQNWIRREKRTEFKPWEVLNDIRSEGKFPDVESLSDGLNRLTDHCFIREREPEQRPRKAGRKSGVVYEVNPIWLCQVAESSGKSKQSPVTLGSTSPIVDSPDLPDEFRAPEDRLDSNTRDRVSDSFDLPDDSASPKSEPDRKIHSGDRACVPPLSNYSDGY